MKAPRAPFASLPMYDWPEIHAETDCLWRTLAAALRDHGFNAPETLLRNPAGLRPLLRAPELLLAQICGMPFANTLMGQVSLLGAPSYDIPHAFSGAYYSEIVVRANTDAETIPSLRGGRLARNAPESWSGWGVWRPILERMPQRERFFAQILDSGAHRESIRMVAEGAADIAAIDAVVWRLALRHEPKARALRVIAHTPPAPAPACITARRTQEAVRAMRSAILEGLGALSPSLRKTLHLTGGFREWREEDYAVFRCRGG